MLLDARTSQNISFAGAVAIPLPALTPTSIGVVGLSTAGASGIIRVLFSGTAGIAITSPTTADSVINLTVVRGSSLEEDPIVAISSYPVTTFETGTYNVTLIGSDYNPPYPQSGQLLYTLFVTSTLPATRVGMESFNASAYSD